MIVFSGEYISAETGEEKLFSTDKVWDIRNMVLRMKDGDALVVNASEEDDR